MHGQSLQTAALALILYEHDDEMHHDKRISVALYFRASRRANIVCKGRFAAAKRRLRSQGRALLLMVTSTLSLLCAEFFLYLVHGLNGFAQSGLRSGGNKSC